MFRSKSRAHSTVSDNPAYLDHSDFHAIKRNEEADLKGNVKVQST